MTDALRLNKQIHVEWRELFNGSVCDRWPSVRMHYYQFYFQLRWVRQISLMSRHLKHRTTQSIHPSTWWWPHSNTQIQMEIINQFKIHWTQWAQFNLLLIGSVGIDALRNVWTSHVLPILLSFVIFDESLDERKYLKSEKHSLIPSTRK